MKKAVQNWIRDNDNCSGQIESIWGKTLIHLEDLPYNPKRHLQPFYSEFIKINHEKDVQVRLMFADPKIGDLPIIYGSQENTVIDESTNNDVV